jgi:hypothetical protein
MRGSRVRIGILLVALGVTAHALAFRATAQELPYTFFLTRYEMSQSMSNMSQLERIRYHSDGQPFAKAPDGSTLTMSGQGAWEPTSKRASGGGQYKITDASGAVKAQGAWRVTSFLSFQKLPGWFGMPGLKEEGWQGPPGSASFSGFLKVNVQLDNLGDGVLETWCLMPEAPMPGDHTSDGIALNGPGLNFPDYHDNETAGDQGVMFYSTNPTDDGYVLAADGTTVYRAGTPGRLPAAGEYDGSPMWVLTLALVSLGLIGAGLGVLRRSA